MLYFYLLPYRLSLFLNPSKNPILRTGGKNTQKNCTKKIFMTQIITMVWSLTEELFKKDLHNPDNHDGVITHLEPDILECKVKWALGKHHYEQS